MLTAGLAYYLVSTLWATRPPLGTSLLLVGGLAVALGYLNYQFGTAQLLRSLDAVEVPRREAPGLYDRVGGIAARMDIDTPRLLVAEMQLPNAMALGGGRDGVVVIDRSLFTLLSGDEPETIVGLVTVALLPALLFVTGIARGVAWIRGRPARWDDGTLGRFRDFVSTGVVVVLLVLTLLIRAHSRRREFARTRARRPSLGNRSRSRARRPRSTASPIPPGACSHRSTLGATRRDRSAASSRRTRRLGSASTGS